MTRKLVLFQHWPVLVSVSCSPVATTVVSEEKQKDSVVILFIREHVHIPSFCAYACTNDQTHSCLRKASCGRDNSCQCLWVISFYLGRVFWGLLWFYLILKWSLKKEILKISGIFNSWAFHNLIIRDFKVITSSKEFW